MKNFVNDPQVVGKWSLKGLSETLEDVKNEKYYKNQDYIINDLYLMEGGKEYWVIGWTKGYILINGRKNPYTIDENKMIVHITFNGQSAFYAVYEKIDSINHKIEDFRIYDNIDIPFKENKKMVGFYEAVCIVNNPQQFIPNKKSEWDLFVKKLAVSPDGTAIFTFDNGRTSTNKWSNDLILDDCDITASKCIFKNFDGDTYMFMEWKSGDYIFGAKLVCYYVFKKLT